MSVYCWVRSGERWIDIVAEAFLPRWDDGHDISLRDGRRVNIATQALHDEPGQILLLKDVSETRRLQEMLKVQPLLIPFYYKHLIWQ